MRGRAFQTMAALALAMSLLAGCAVQPKMKATYYPACYEPMEYLKDSQTRLVGATAGGVVAGAVLGGLIGAAIGRGDGWAIAAGATAGGLAGGLLAYSHMKQKQITEDNARYASYSDDMRRDVFNADRTIRFAQTARNCYDSRFKELIADVKAGKLTRAEADARFKEIEQGMKLVSDNLGKAQSAFDEKAQTYEAALADEARRKNTSVDQIQVPQPAPAKPEPAQAPAKPKAKQKAAKKDEPEPAPAAPAKTAPAPATPAQVNTTTAMAPEAPAARAAAPADAEPVEPSKVPAENASLALMKDDMNKVAAKRGEIVEAKRDVDDRMALMATEFKDAQA